MSSEQPPRRSRLRNFGCGILILFAILFVMSREGQSLLSFLWVIVKLFFEVIGNHLGLN